MGAVPDNTETGSDGKRRVRAGVRAESDSNAKVFVSSVLLFVCPFFVPSPKGLLMANRDDVAPTVVSAAKRRMLRRLRSHWRHEQFSIRMALASAVHHSHMRVAPQTDFVLAATYAATAEAPQVVGSFLLSDDFAASMYNQVHQEQLVATVQPHAIFIETPEVQVVDQILEQIVEPPKCFHMSV